MKRVLVIALFVGATIVAGGWWYHRYQLLADRRAATAQSAAVEAALQERIDTADFAGDDRPWGQVLDALKSRCDVPLDINQAETAAMGVDRQTRVFVPEGVFPLDELLDEITGRMDIAWRPAGGGIEITALSIADASRDKLVTRVYPLPAGSAAGENLTDDARALCEWIHNMIQPHTWEEVGGDGVIVPAGGAVVVRQRESVHRQIRHILAQMESLPNRPARQLALDPAAADERERIEKALAELDSVHLQNRPLVEALDDLAVRHRLKVQFSASALATGAANPSIPVTLSLSNVSAGTILRELLATRQLTYVIRNGSIVVTTPDDAESRLPPVIYDAGDLVDVSGESGMDALIDLVTSAVAPDAWDDVGGPGTISEMGDRWLVVCQTEENHHQLERLLARLQALLEPGVDPAADALLEPIDDLAPAVAQALDREVTLKYDAVPLGDVCRELSQRLSIPVRPRLYPDADVAVGRPVTCDLPPLPLRDALAILLEKDYLMIDPRGEVLYVTTPSDVHRNLVTRIIDVRHLLDPAVDGANGDSLIDLVTTCIEPDSWENVGGPGSAEIFHGLLVYRQTYEINRQVQQLMDALREHWLPLPPDGSEAATPVNPRQPVWIDAAGGVEKIAAALATRRTVHLEPPIEPLVRRLCGEQGIPCYVDPDWREEQQVDVPWPGYVLDMVDQPLDVILSKLVESKDGGIAISHGVLLVTDRESAESQLLPRLYPMERFEVGGTVLTAQRTADYLTERLDCQTWRYNGGPGIIEPVGDQWLLVVQTLPMHRKVEEALDKLARGEILPVPMP